MPPELQYPQASKTEMYVNIYCNNCNINNHV